MVLCVLELSVTWASALISLFLSVERGRPVGVDVCLRSVRAADGTTGEGAASTREMGDMMGALTGRVFLSGVETMADRMMDETDEEKGIRHCMNSNSKSLSVWTRVNGLLKECCPRSQSGQ